MFGFQNESLIFVETKPKQMKTLKLRNGKEYKTLAAIMFIVSGEGTKIVFIDHESGLPVYVLTNEITSIF